MKRDDLCICQYCGREYIWKREQGHSTITCNSCFAKRRRYSITKKKFDILGRECSMCGYSKCLAALQAHHLDGSKKEFNISHAEHKSNLAIEEEIKKCIILCGNCHQRLHHPNFDDLL